MPDTYPTDAWACMLRWITGEQEARTYVEDLNAGDLVFLPVESPSAGGPVLVVLGGDAACEGCVGLSVWDHEYESIDGIGDSTGWIEAEDWWQLRDRVRAALDLDGGT